MGRDGGTRFWCEQCVKIQPFSVANDLLIQPHNGLYEADGIPFRRRRKYCTQCGFEIFTAELDEDYLDEFLDLRKKLISIQETLDEEVSKIKASRDRKRTKLLEKAEALIKDLGLGD
jgi:hypothetical protein